MAILDFQSLMLPVLKESAAGEVRISDVVGSLGAKLALSEAELSELLSPNASTLGALHLYGVLRSARDLDSTLQSR